MGLGVSASAVSILQQHLAAAHATIAQLSSGSPSTPPQADTQACICDGDGTERSADSSDCSIDTCLTTTANAAAHGGEQTPGQRGLAPLHGARYSCDDSDVIGFDASRPKGTANPSLSP